MAGMNFREKILSWETLPEWRGDLMGARTANLLPGVWSSRMPLKLRNRSVETLLSAWAEPWGGFLIMFIVMLVLAGVFVFLGVRKVKRVRAPERTISSIRETAAAITHRGGEDATPGTEVSVDVSGTAVRPS